MKTLFPAALLIVYAAGMTACVGPYPPPPPPPGPRGRNLDMPPRYGAGEEQTRYFDGANMVDPATVQAPDPSMPVPGTSGTPLPPNTSGPTAPPPVVVTPPTPSTPTPPPAPTEIPYATRIANKPGFVKSPFDPNGQAIDVRDFQSGQKARCPYTGKIFRVP
ncbi:MAG TPA: hypothetical protein VGE39_11780 [Prosthecobacter sp.]